jgi:hypothetical protein
LRDPLGLFESATLLPFLARRVFFWGTEQEHWTLKLLTMIDFEGACREEMVTGEGVPQFWRFSGLPIQGNGNVGALVNKCQICEMLPSPGRGSHRRHPDLDVQSRFWFAYRGVPWDVPDMHHPCPGFRHRVNKSSYFWKEWYNRESFPYVPVFHCFHPFSLFKWFHGSRAGCSVHGPMVLVFGLMVILFIASGVILINVILELFGLLTAVDGAIVMIIVPVVIVVM